MAKRVFALFFEFSCKNSTIAQAMEIPSYVEVPRPSSSNSTRLRSEMLFKMLAASFISTMKVDSPKEMLSDAPTRVKTLSTYPIFADLAGTKHPAWAMITMSAVWRKRADLPAMLGPVIMMICCLSLSR